MKAYQEAVDELKSIVQEHDNIVFFGGAGVSTESGIPDFRSVDGLYHQQYDYPPETLGFLLASVLDVLLKRRSVH